MFALEDLLGTERGQEAAQQISRNLGADQQSVNNAIQMALPVILGGLSKNVEGHEGAASLNRALEQDHDGSLLENLSDYLTGGVPAPERADRQTNGAGILEHILGTRQGQAAQEISNNTDLNTGQVANLLITLAPIVMAYLGRQKRQNDLGADGVSEMVREQQQRVQSSGNPMIDMASRWLDKDGDGSAVDDLASMAAGYFMK